MAGAAKAKKKTRRRGAGRPPQPPARRFRWPATAPAFFILALALPPLLLAWLVFRFAVDLPLVDQWSVIYDIERYLTGQWTWTDLLRSHNGHRLLVPRLILIPLAALTGWNTRVEMSLSWFIAAGMFGMYIAVARPAFGRLGRWAAVVTAAIVSAAHFSANQYENWLWGLQMHVVLAAAAATGGLALLASRWASRWRVPAAVFAGLVSTFSQATGLAFWWVAAGFALFERREESRRARWLRFAGWLVAAAAISALYLHRRPGDAGVPGRLYLLTDPLGYFHFVLSLLGFPFASWSGSPGQEMDLGVAWIVGAIGLALFGREAWQAVRGQESPTWPTWPIWKMQLVLIGAFSVGAAFLTAMARATSPLGAFNSRYITLSTPFCVALSVLLADRAASRFGDARATGGWAKAGARATGAVALLVLISILAGSFFHLHYYPGRRSFFERVSRALVQGGPFALLQYISPHRAGIEGGRPILERHRLSVFRPGTRIPPVLARPERLTQYAQKLSWREPPPRSLSADALVRLPVRVENPSAVTWPTLGADFYQTGAVRLTYTWQSTAPGARTIMGKRTDLSFDLPPAGAVDLAMCLEAPPKPGRYRLRVTLVQEKFGWFDERGSPGLSELVEIEESTLGRLGSRLRFGLGTLAGASRCS